MFAFKMKNNVCRLVKDFDFTQKGMIKSSSFYLSWPFASTMSNVVIKCNKYNSLMPCHILQYL